MLVLLNDLVSRCDDIWGEALRWVLLRPKVSTLGRLDDENFIGLNHYFNVDFLVRPFVK
jgi:hypothetical protein